VLTFDFRLPPGPRTVEYALLTEELGFRAVCCPEIPAFGHVFSAMRARVIHISFRHYLKSELLARDVPERISDAITGHKTPGIGRKYEHVPMSKKFDTISKLPVIPL
jgi:hypothetical protein